jgi:hypothetical protein
MRTELGQSHLGALIPLLLYVCAALLQWIEVLYRGLKPLNWGRPLGRSDIGHLFLLLFAAWLFQEICCGT